MGVEALGFGRKKETKGCVLLAREREEYNRFHCKTKMKNGKIT